MIVLEESGQNKPSTAKWESATNVSGLDYIDVPAAEKRDYALNFFAHKEGLVQAKVFFRNESTGEYVVYLVNFKATAPGTIDTINLTTSVRRAISHQIKIENPLQNQVNFNSECKLNGISVPSSFTIPSNGEGSCTFEYLPLKSGTLSGRLIFTSSDLGTYQYDLNLTALPPAPEPPTHYNTWLGATQTHSVKFTNFSKHKTEFVVKIDSPDWSTERSIPVAQAATAGSEVAFDVNYEPTQLGKRSTMMTISSPSGGDYTFPLVGMCTEPTPQGPFTIRSRASVVIQFKNIFNKPTEFHMMTDNPCFTVSKAVETIKAKKTHFFNVFFNAEESSSIQTGKLTITVPKKLPGVNWVFYLRGVVDQV